MNQMTEADAILSINSFSDWIGLETNAARIALQNQLTQWKTDDDAYRLSHKFRKFKSIDISYDICEPIFKEIGDIEEELTALMESESPLENESYQELLLLSSPFHALNFIPYVLTIWSFVRVYLLPGMSMLLPLLTLIAPYFILHYILRVPITFTRYTNIIQSMFSGNINGIVNPGNESTPSSLLKQTGLLSMTFLQSVLQPYWSHQHLYSIDTIIQKQGRLLIRFKELYQELETTMKSHGITMFRCPLPEMKNEREAMARMVLETTYFQLALKYIGSLEVMIKLSHQKHILPVKWVTTKSNKPVFISKDSFDFQVLESKRKYFSCNLDQNRHALITGPNKGGKSTVLRALSVSALLAHTYGCALGHLTATSFNKLFVCLKPDDLPGSQSRFEREIVFTASTLKPSEKSIIFIDELFHSTNPSDAHRSSELYCNQLWNKSNTVSAISTHIFEWVENAPNHIQRICCPASIKDSKLIFQYDLVPGICKISSVDTLLEQYHLVKK